MCPRSSDRLRIACLWSGCSFRLQLVKDSTVARDPCRLQARVADPAGVDLDPYLQARVADPAGVDPDPCLQARAADLAGVDPDP